ncbi:MFS transporter [Actinokineospora fastidiosa]|uniref:MFS transporter n=1 Tax=Actinokineospora fastidiosa TaxID=1816 RepID=A0A918LF01_9PSEU|nr:MFS transporter [Actinokineospora fastidiosa]GGS38292.1 MFS transporter [Actinokineospora fastidiosa]
MGGGTRLGREFGKLWTATAATNIGDGIALAAGPLLISSLTDDPRLVAGAVFAQQLPWLLFALFSGAWVDRLDRRKVIAVVDVLRAVVVAGLAVAVWGGLATVWVVYLAFFLIGIAETFADTAAGALLPALVAPEALPRANARLTAVLYVGNQFAAPPIGAALFAVAAALPFGVNAVAFLLASAVMLSIRHRPAPRERPTTRLTSEIREGVRWLWSHGLLRTLGLCLGVMNLLLMAAFAIYVLYAKERLGLDEIGFGVLITAGAVGGLIGTALVSPLRGRFGEHTLLRAGLVVETLTHVGLALATDAWVAAAITVVFGCHGAIWGVVATSVRQRVVPDELRGRVDSVYRLLVIGGAALGAPLSGVLAVWLGVTGPFWVAAGAMAVLSAVVWRKFSRAAFAI